MPLLRSILTRVLAAVPNLIGVVVATFIMMRFLPGDPAAFFAGPAATAQSIAEVRTRLGLDRSPILQFAGYVGDLAHGNLGASLTSGQPVLTDIARRLPASLELTLAALTVAVAAGILLGVGAAVRPGGWLDRLCSALSTLGQATPTFFLGLVLVFVFYYLLGWAPSPIGRLDVVWSAPPAVTGFYTVDALLAGELQVFVAAASQLVLPVITLAAFGLGPVARMTRASMIEALAGDYVRTARAAGLPRRIVLWRHAFPNAAVPIVNTIGMVFSFMLGANVLVEKVFGWPGVGSYAIEAVLASDVAPVQGFVLVMAALYLVVNLMIDITTALIDPRVAVDG
ncbi:MAG TPA: ABC transporter permease [Bradyrhizobium sp.]|nr:ABC transporter permease [Bradyrhizobium sp.]